MRIDEVAGAEDQIALFKLITDKVWQSLGDQQRAEAEVKAAQPLKAKLRVKAPPKQPEPRRLLLNKPVIKQQQIGPAKHQLVLNKPEVAKSLSGISAKKNSLPSKIPSNDSIDAIQSADSTV